MLTGNKAIVDHQLHKRPSEATRVYNEIRFLEPLITADILQNAEDVGTKMEGLIYSVKTASSVEDKLQRIENAQPQKHELFASELKNAISELKDIIRYTEICNHNDIIPTARATIENLRAKGYVLCGVSNFYITPYPATGYRGLHLNFVSPYGQEIELQVHSPESFKAKMDGHVLYEKVRSVSTPVKIKDALLEEVQKIHRAVPLCNDFLSLSSYKMPIEQKRGLIKERKEAVTVDIDEKLHNADTGTKTTIFSVSVSKEPKLSGFEHTFSDGSIWSYRSDKTKEQNEIAFIQSDGTLIQEKPAVEIRLDMDYIESITDKQESAHKAWMALHAIERDEIPSRTDTVRHQNTEPGR